jgi:hypothetical protein
MVPLEASFSITLSPLVDPAERNVNDDGPTLRTSAKEGKEFRPFARRLPEL